MHNNNNQKNMDPFKKNNINKKYKKMIKLYICKNREIEITFKYCVIFKENKLFTMKFKE